MIYPYCLNERPVVPPITPPRIKAAHHDSKVNAISKTGNRVFKDQIVASGPIIIMVIISANQRINLIIMKTPI